LILSGKLKNGGFENITSPENNVLTGWTKSGDGRVCLGLGSTWPTEGAYMAIISTGLGYTTSSGLIEQDFCLDSDAKKLEFDWNFFSEEFKEYCGSMYQDSFSVKMYVVNLSTGATESETLLFNRKIDDLCSMVYEADVHFDQSSEGCQPISSNDCKVWNTGWQKAQIDISSFADKSVRLGFYASDIGDSIFDSAILVDNITISK